MRGLRDQKKGYTTGFGITPAYAGTTSAKYSSSIVL